MNPFGSVKDRTAWAMVKDDLEDLKRMEKLYTKIPAATQPKSLQAIANIHGLNSILLAHWQRLRSRRKLCRSWARVLKRLRGPAIAFDTSDPNDPQYLIERKLSLILTVFISSQFTNRKTLTIMNIQRVREFWMI